MVDAELHRPGDLLTYRAGGAGTVPVEQAPDGTRFVRLNLPGHRFAVLS